MSKPLAIVSWLRTHKKRMLAHGSILFAFLIYVVFLSGPLFSKFERTENESRLHGVSLPGETNTIRYGYGLDVRMGVIEMLGWAFVEGQSFGNSQTYAVLKSSGNTYVFDTAERAELRFNEQLGIEAPDVRRAGFVAFMPISNIRTGVYDVGIYISDGEREALQYTDRVLVKNGNLVRVVSRKSSLQQISLPEESGNITFSIDSLNEISEEGTEFVDIAGWAFIDGQSPMNSKTYVLLASSTEVYIFGTVATAVPNVTKRFEALNLNLTYSGFKARIAKELIEDGTYEIGIYIRKDAAKAVQYTGAQVLIAMHTGSAAN